MATAATEIKPDWSAPKRHFCLTDEHEALREGCISCHQGVNVGGYFRTESGVGTAGRRYLRALRSLPLCLALGWEAAVRVGLAQGRLMPPPSRVLNTLAALTMSGELATHTLATLARVGDGPSHGYCSG